MSKSTKKIAIPSTAPGGLNALRSEHFGHCDCFTIVEVESNRIVQVSVLNNPPHVNGGCLTPVNLLSRNGVNFIVISGMGMRPLLGFKSVGIDVLLGKGELVSESIDAYNRGELTPFSEELTCDGN